MRIQTNPVAAAAAILISSALGVSADLITFRVNMDYQITLGNFFPGSGTVEARGSFNGWSGGFILTNVPSTTIYENVYEVSGNSGDTINYKFWHSGDGTGDNWESGGDRSFQLTGSPQTVYRYFNDTWGGGPPVAITFQVDLLPRILAGTFDPINDVVEARGSFQTGSTWTSGFVLTNSPTDPNVFTGTYDVTMIPPGGRAEYKFVVIKNGDQWEGDPNRFFIMPEEPLTLPLVTFNREVPSSTTVTFQVDLSYLAGFDPFLDKVETRGSFQSAPWSGGFTLTNDPAGPNTNLYSGTYKVFHSPGTTEQYKFYIDYYLKDDQWENDPNRSFVLSNDVQVLSAVYFNNAKPTDLLSQDTLVTFTVSMTNAVTYPDGVAFDPMFDSLYVNGNFAGWWSWGSTPGEYTLTNDVASGNKLYSATVLFPRGSQLRLEYKYGINGNDNEAGFQQNRVRYIRQVGTYNLPLDVFGLMTVEPEVGSLSIGQVSGGQVTLTWNGRPGVHLQSSTSLGGTWQDVPETEGASSKTVSVSGNEFFRLIKP